MGQRVLLNHDAHSSSRCVSPVGYTSNMKGSRPTEYSAGSLSGKAPDVDIFIRRSIGGLNPVLHVCMIGLFIQV